jgi:hypothetical protein
MTRSGSLAILMVAALAGGCRPAQLLAQENSGLAGPWTLNRDLSEFPREIGFDVDWAPSSAPGSASGAGAGRSRRGSNTGSGGAGARPFTASRESQDDARRMLQLTEQVREPSAHLTIVETDTAVTITDEHDRSQTFHPNAGEEILQLDGVPVAVTARRDAGALSVLYRVEEGRDLRYTYSRAAHSTSLAVDVEFVGRGGGDAVRRIYEPTRAPAPAVADAAPSPAAARSDGASPTTSAFNQQPDAELKGLTRLGLVVEDLSPQAAVCGLRQNTLESSLSKRLSDAGFRVARNSDEDTYLYVNVVTTALSNGLCVSRYDAFLYTHTTARLSYQQTPVLVQVSLLHEGGIAGGAPAVHADGVARGLLEYVDQFVARIRDANK